METAEFLPTSLTTRGVTLLQVLSALDGDNSKVEANGDFLSYIDCLHVVGPSG